jgi:hypothetical protein
MFLTRLDKNSLNFIFFKKIKLVSAVFSINHPQINVLRHYIAIVNAQYLFHLVTVR